MMTIMKHYVGSSMMTIMKHYVDSSMMTIMKHYVDSSATVGANSFAIRVTG